MHNPAKEFKDGVYANSNLFTANTENDGLKLKTWTKCDLRQTKMYF